MVSLAPEYKSIEVKAKRLISYNSKPAVLFNSGCMAWSFVGRFWMAFISMELGQHVNIALRDYLELWKQIHLELMLSKVAEMPLCVMCERQDLTPASPMHLAVNGAR